MTMYVFMEKYEINQVIVVEEVSDQERYLRRIHLSRAQHFLQDYLCAQRRLRSAYYARMLY